MTPKDWKVVTDGVSLTITIDEDIPFTVDMREIQATSIGMRYGFPGDTHGDIVLIMKHKTKVRIPKDCDPSGTLIDTPGTTELVPVLDKINALIGEYRQYRK